MQKNIPVPTNLSTVDPEDKESSKASQKPTTTFRLD